MMYESVDLEILTQYIMKNKPLIESKEQFINIYFDLVSDEILKKIHDTQPAQSDDSRQA